MFIITPEFWRFFTNRGQPIDISAVDNHVVVATWWLDSRGYPVGRVFGKRRYLHHVIAERMGLSKELHVDHVDGNRQNNRRDNLRSVTPSQSSQNRGPKRNGPSEYKGVRPRKNGGWNAYFCGVCLGTFLHAEDAAIAYDYAALRKYGMHARLNFPNGPSTNVVR